MQHGEDKKHKVFVGKPPGPRELRLRVDGLAIVKWTSRKQGDRI
jgi:hypothetical protein